jgi:hypothetical protein
LLLLRAALCDGASALEAWLEFRAMGTGIDHLEGDAFRVLPQLFRNLQALEFEDPVLGRLRGMYRHAWYTNQLLIQEVSGAIALLRAEAIDTMIFDGGALVARGTRDVGARLMDSIDIVARFRDVERAVEVLGMHGWMSSGRHAPNQSMRVFELVNGRHTKLILHRSVLSFGDYDNEIWGAADTVCLRGVTTLAPCLVDQLLMDCAHGLSWVPASRRWIPDVMLLVRANRGLIDWRCLAERSRRLEVALDVADALEFLGLEFQLDFPPKLLAGLRTRASPRQRAVHQVKMRPRRRSVGSRVVRRAMRACDALVRLAAAPGAGRSHERVWMLVEEFGARQWFAAAVRTVRQAVGRPRA